MSEKGQGEESNEGTGTGTTTRGTGTGTGTGTGSAAGGTPGGGSTKARTPGAFIPPPEGMKPPPVDTAPGPGGAGGTQTRGPGSIATDDLKPSDFPPPPVDEPGEPAEPTFPGGGPTDTRQDAELEADLAEDARREERRQNEEDERRERRQARGPEEDASGIEPPSLTPPEGPLDPSTMTPEELEEYKKTHPRLGDWQDAKGVKQPPIDVT